MSLKETDTQDLLSTIVIIILFFLILSIPFYKIIEKSIILTNIITSFFSALIILLIISIILVFVFPCVIMDKADRILIFFACFIICIDMIFIRLLTIIKQPFPDWFAVIGSIALFGSISIVLFFGIFVLGIGSKWGN